MGIPRLPASMQGSLVLSLCLVLSCNGCSRPIQQATTTPPPSTCATYSPSARSPSRVSRLRPGDIGIIAAIGDSDTAAFGSRATNLLGMTSEERDISFVSGTAADWQTQTSLANMLLRYNPNLIGGSSGSNSVIFPGGDASKGLNLAISGAWAGGPGQASAPGQADILVTEIQKVSGWEDTWKLITIQLGGNDVCVASCGEGGADYAGDATPAGWKSNMKTALTTLKNSLPKTLVVFTSPYDPTKLNDITNKPFACQFIFPSLCPCLSDSSRPGMVELRNQYEEKLVELAAEMRSDQFGVEVIPALENLYPESPSGGPDAAFLAPDCYHFTAKLHSMIGKNVWNNLIEDPAQRTSNYGQDLEIACPNNGQFLSITK